MKPPTEQLLDDLFEEAAPAEFRAALMDQTLRQAQRRQVVRRAGAGVGITALIAALAAIFWNGPKQDSPLSVTTNPLQAPGLNVVESQPLNPSQTVQTGLSSAMLVVSSDSAASTLSLVRIEPSVRTYVEINDQQLLALLSGRPVSLVRHGPNQAELIFLNPEDQKDLFLP